MRRLEEERYDDEEDDEDEEQDEEKEEDDDEDEDDEDSPKARKKAWKKAQEKDPVEFMATAIRETEKALLVEIHGYGEHWLPKSQIDEDSDVRGEGDHGALLISNWIAEQKELV